MKDDPASHHDSDSVRDDLYQDSTTSSSHSRIGAGTGTGDFPTVLHAAVRLGDLIRKHSNSYQETTRTTTTTPGTAEWLKTPPPGLVDGLVAGALIATLLTPVRSQILKAIPKTTLGILPDLVVTSTQAVAAATSALYVGSLQGSRMYLQQLSRIPPNESSEMADAVCSSDLVKRLLFLQEEEDEWGTGGKGGQVAALVRDYYFSQDPRRQTLESFAAALQSCQRRRSKDRTYGGDQLV